MRSVVRIYPDPPVFGDLTTGAIAQLGEHLLCKQGVAGSIPAGSTRSVQRDTTHAPHRSMHAWSHVSRQTSRNALFKNSNLGMTPRIKLFQLVIRKRVAFARERYQLIFDELFDHVIPERLGLYGQANKRTWWMPWR